MAVPGTPAPAAPRAPTDPGSASELAGLLQGADGGAFEDESLLPVSPNAPFYLRHHPDNWEVEEEGLDAPTWLPELHQHPLQPGVRGVRTISKGEPKTEAYRDSVSKAKTYGGFTYLDPQRAIPDEFIPSGVPTGRGYLRDAPCADLRSGQRGRFHTEPWNVPIWTPKGRPQRFRFDRALYNRWRVWLVETGQVDPPHEWALDEARGRIVTRIERKRGNVDIPSEVRDATVARDVARLEAMESAAVAGAEPAAEPDAPAKKSRGKAAS